MAFMGDSLLGKLVVDCGCGPGQLIPALLSTGARRVYAVDGNQSMIKQAARAAPGSVEDGRLRLVRMWFSPQMFASILEQEPSHTGLDLVLFKRSLYCPPVEAVALLRAAVSSLNPGGRVVVIHPDRSLRNYACVTGGKPASYTPYHLTNRLGSLVGFWLGLGDYRLYSRAELLDMLRKAAPMARVQFIPSRQQSYNLAAIQA